MGHADLKATSDYLRADINHRVKRNEEKVLFSSSSARSINYRQNPVNVDDDLEIREFCRSSP